MKRLTVKQDSERINLISLPYKRLVMVPCSALIYLPIANSLWLLLTLFATYLVTYLSGHLETTYIMPYISTLGDIHPESSVFSFMFCVAGFLSAMVILFRFGQISAQLTHSTQPVEQLNWLRHLNRIVLSCGLIMAFGAAITGCFQLTAVKTIHFIGASLLCVGGIVYVILHTVMCCALVIRGIDPNGRQELCVLRAVLAGACASALLVFMLRVYRDVEGTQTSRHYMVARAFCQWIGAICLVIYMFTLVHEFKRLRCSVSFETIVTEVVDETQEHTQ